MHLRPRLAVLIDAAGVGAWCVEPLIDQLAKHGRLTVARAYGDWSSRLLRGWVGELDRHGIEPVQRFSRPEAGSTSLVSIAVDALDLLHTDRVQAFALVGCGDPAASLAMRLRADGATVVGVGPAERARALAAACDEFLPLHELAPASAPEAPHLVSYRGRHRADVLPRERAAQPTP